MLQELLSLMRMMQYVSFLDWSSNRITVNPFCKYAQSVLAGATDQCHAASEDFR